MSIANTSPSVALNMGSISHPTSAFMFNEIRTSGGKVGIGEASGDNLSSKQQTSAFANGLI